jgi:hypothetical protein
MKVSLHQWCAVDNNYMFQPSDGHHQVFTSLKRKGKRSVTYRLPFLFKLVKT